MATKNDGENMKTATAYDPNNHTLRACFFDAEQGELLQDLCELAAAGDECERRPVLTCNDIEMDQRFRVTFFIDNQGCFDTLSVVEVS